MATNPVIIPSTITVHLGRPDEAAENVTVPFTEYIKNVASNEIYPTWPENAIIANILAQISFALNKVYTEYYRSRGYDFDITNNTVIDQAFVPDSETFDNISRIVDRIFNNYIVRSGSIVPLYAQFCDGVNTQCSGLSQWGTVTLAEQGMSPIDILKYYYGNDIEIVYNAPVGENTPSYLGIPLRRGSYGDDVLIIKRELNRIRQNYPAIPYIASVNSGIFDLDTEAAVRSFQQIFNLNVDGIVGKATWYKIKQVYSAVKQLSELTSEGLTISEVERRYVRDLRLGDSGVDVKALQYYLAFLGYFMAELPPIPITGTFDQATQDAVYAFQSAYGLPVTGVVDFNTFLRIDEVYKATVRNLPANYQSAIGEPYPGKFLVLGDRGENVRIIQQYLQVIAQNDPNIPNVSVTGEFDDATRAAVIALQRQLGIEESGAIGPVLWSEIITRGNRL
ncbi:MAG: peptidoglycan-binding protein [Clostridia bacterium]|nr:peptidoglycan-binding protein [Clostridia bacterium]